MEYKLVAIDCDNTLIKSDGEIHPDNIIAINKLLDKGIKIVIATGRNDILVKEYMDEAGFKEEVVISCNGASIRDLKTNQTIKASFIPKEKVKEIIDVCHEEDIEATFFTLEKSYSTKPRSLELKTTISKTHYTKRLKTSIKNNFDADFEKVIAENDFLKMVIIELDPQRLLKLRSLFKKINNISVFISSKHCLDIVAEGVSKGSALAEYADILGINTDQTIAIGDSENDIEMLKTAGVSIAMGNSSQDVKDVCDIITEDNNNGGVAIALNKIFEL
ncbi:MAG: Cof-type HAD-IIB family hydrolase [bacterium]